MRTPRLAAAAAVVGLLAGLAAAGWAAAGALKKGDPVAGVAFLRPDLDLGELKGTATLVNFNGWT